MRIINDGGMIQKSLNLLMARELVDHKLQGGLTVINK